MSGRDVAFSVYSRMVESVGHGRCFACGRSPMQLDVDMSVDGRWLTYDHLARLRRIDKPSAVKLATRNGWQRRKNNSGHMQVLVPLDWLERARDRRDKYADDDTDMAALLAEANRRADAAASLADRLVAQLGEANARADRAEARADRAEEARAGRRRNRPRRWSGRRPTGRRGAAGHGSGRRGGGAASGNQSYPTLSGATCPRTSRRWRWR
jgi:hypothetical protein